MIDSKGNNFTIGDTLYSSLGKENRALIQCTGINTYGGMERAEMDWLHNADKPFRVTQKAMQSCYWVVKGG